MAQDPDLSTTIREAMISALAEVHTSIPAKVVEFSSGPPATVKVSIVLDYFHRGEGPDAEPVRFTLDQIDNVPVVFPGSGGYGSTFPISAGDFVLLVFCERSIADWLRNGGTGIAPTHRRRHSLSDAFALPGARPKTDDIPAAGHDADAYVVRVPAGKSIKLGQTATKGVNREGDDVLAGSSFAATMAAINTALTTLAGDPAITVVITPPPATPAGSVIGETGTGSSVVKADD